MPTEDELIAQYLQDEGVTPVAQKLDLERIYNEMMAEEAKRGRSASPRQSEDTESANEFSAELGGVVAPKGQRIKPHRRELQDLKLEDLLRDPLYDMRLRYRRSF